MPTARTDARSATRRWLRRFARCLACRARTSRKCSNSKPWKIPSRRRSSICLRTSLVPRTRGTPWPRPCTRACSIGWCGASIRARCPKEAARRHTRSASWTFMASRSLSGTPSSSFASTSRTRSCSSTSTRTCSPWSSSCTPKKASLGRTSHGRTIARSSMHWRRNHWDCSVLWTPSASCRMRKTKLASTRSTTASKPPRLSTSLRALPPPTLLWRTTLAR
mmetsp:Transcript_5431/g.20577  ORF Transcript_5431/g.20577 Transcript_5431/m.20577 type:complete len:221 (-) Transcript_5431:3975-4637(-)